MQRYLGWGSDAAELSLEDQTAAVCQSEHPVGADLHSQDEQMDNLRQFQFHLLLAPHYYKSFLMNWKNIIYHYEI